MQAHGGSCITLVDGLCAQSGGLKHAGTQRIMHNTCCTVQLWATAGQAIPPGMIQHMVDLWDSTAAH